MLYPLKPDAGLYHLKYTDQSENDFINIFLLYCVRGGLILYKVLMY